MNYLCRHTKFVPLLLCLLIPVTFFITYGISLSNKHVSSVWPYISDTGSLPPESCVFGQLLNIAAFLLACVVYIRYRQVSEYIKLRPKVRINRFINRIVIVLGFVSCMGLSIVANFQESNVLSVHLIGAMMCFFSGTIYFIFQTVFTYLMSYGAKTLLWARILFSFLMSLFIVTTLAPLQSALRDFKGEDVKLWKKKDGGFSYHLISTFSEWFLCFAFCAYIGSFIWEFRSIEILSPIVKLTDVEAEEKLNNRFKNGNVNPSFDAVENNLTQSQWI